jgi:predicted lipid-binding transport protein (Tim44 family)
MDIRLIIIAILCLGIGFVIGLLTQAGRADRGEEAAALTTPPGILPAAPPPVPSLPPAPAVAAPADISKQGKSGPAAPVSLVEQVNDILKETSRPAELANVYIKLEETAEGVRFWVGNTPYSGLEQVPAAAREFIRTAVRAWGGN